MSIFSISNKALTRLASNSSKQLQAYITEVGQISLKKTETTAQNVEAATNILFSYIPVEIIALYVAVLGALSVDPTMQSQWITFYIFTVLTPVVLWLVYAAKVKSMDDPLPIHPSKWPVWEMVASTLAFVAWAFALPESPFSTLSWYNQPLAGVNILATSTILGLLAPFFENK